MASTAVLQERVQLAKTWLEEQGKDSPAAKEFVFQAFAVVTFLASQKIHLKDIGRGNMGIKLLPTPRVCFFDTMSWMEARPRAKPYAWTGLWKLASEYVSTSYDTLNAIRTRHNRAGKACWEHSLLIARATVRSSKKWGSCVQMEPCKAFREGR